MEIVLITLEKGITGLIAVSPDVENTLQTIYKNKVPHQWLKSN